MSVINSLALALCQISAWNISNKKVLESFRDQITDTNFLSRITKLADRDISPIPLATIKTRLGLLPKLFFMEQITEQERKVVHDLLLQFIKD